MSRTFRSWAVDVEYTDGEKETRYWDQKMGFCFWNFGTVPSWPIQAITVPDASYKDDGWVESYSDVYVVEITVHPKVEKVTEVIKEQITTVTKI